MATTHRMPFLCRSIPQKNPIIIGSFAKNDLQIEASYGTLPPCMYVWHNSFISLQCDALYMYIYITHDVRIHRKRALHLLKRILHTPSCWHCNALYMCDIIHSCICNATHCTCVTWSIHVLHHDALYVCDIIPFMYLQHDILDMCDISIHVFAMRRIVYVWYNLFMHGICVM